MIKKTKVKKYPKRNKLFPETLLQIDIVNWFKLQYPRLYPLLMASAGGLKTTITSGKLMKAMGYKAGTFDLFLAVPRNGYHGLFVEIKTNKKYSKASDSQKKMQELLESQGYRAVILKGFDKIVDEFREYLK